VSSEVRPLALTSGDPGGVGPEVAVRAALQALDAPQGEGAGGLLLYGDAQVLAAEATRQGAAPERLVRIDRGAERALPAGTLGLVDVGLAWTAEARSHAATAAGGRAQLAALDAAIEAALGGRVRGIVTAPMSKAAVNLGGHDFMGHTEHLARAAGLRDDEVTMMFLGPRLCVALATTHVAVADLPREVTTPRVLRAIEHLAEALLRLRVGSTSAAMPLRLGVTGLNPHAGEGGLFGDEEIRAIEPAVRSARERAPFSDGRIQLTGPLGAETALRFAASGELEGVVAMTHDQATIASKLLDWTLAVNVTWGLPFVRTSVDHGVAYDAAAQGTADAAGMRSALEMALRLAPAR
jgi:4-hydroxythreonine-4-phosphate dehydrogenase